MSKKNKWFEAVVYLSLVSQIGIYMLAPILICGYLGSLIDRKFSTGPIFFIILVLIGIGAGFANAYKVAISVIKKGSDPLKSTIGMIFNIIKVMVVVFVLVVIVAFLTDMFSKELLCGLAFGSIFSILNLRLLSLALEKAVNMNPGKAQGYVLSRYIMRLIITALVLLISLKATYINIIGTIIGLLLPKISILIVNLFGIEKIIKGKEA